VNEFVVDFINNGFDPDLINYAPSSSILSTNPISFQIASSPNDAFESRIA